MGEWGLIKGFDPIPLPHPIYASPLLKLGPTHTLLIDDMLPRGNICSDDGFSIGEYKPLD